MNPMQSPNTGVGRKLCSQTLYPNKYRYVTCDNCGLRGHIIPRGKVYGNHGKKQFECGSCGNTWQYGK